MDGEMDLVLEPINEELTKRWLNIPGVGGNRPCRAMSQSSVCEQIAILIGEGGVVKHLIWRKTGPLDKCW